SSAPILHNYMGRETDFDHFAAGGDLEIASWDSYPLGFLEDRIGASDEWKRRFMRQGDPDFQAFHHDLYRAVGRGRWWVMEQQPGPVNWAPHNPAPAPGLARLWAWEAFAHGAEVVAYFRWRQAPRAQEQMHAGLLRSDGARAAGLAEAIETAKDLSAAPDVETTAAPVAIIFDYESQWAWAAQPQGRDFDYFGLVFDIYRALRRLGLSIDVLPPDTADLSPYRFVAAPGLAMIGETLASALAAFDGVALVGPRANAKTGTMASPASAPPNLAGLDCRVAYVESLRADAPIPLAGGGAFVTWREALEGDAEVVIRTESGEPAAMRAGGVVYLAGWPDPAAARLLLEPLLHEAGVETCDMPDALRIRDAGETRFIFNYDLEPATVSGVTVPPASFVTQTRAQVREAK
ncbi:MAG: beta-galactosidase, partial [Pseudomonadota bacterium]